MNDRNYLNSIYEPLHNIACDCATALLEEGYTVRLEYYNLHEVKVGKDYITEFFPLPEIEIECSAGACDLGFSLDRNAWLEITISKNDALLLDYSAIKNDITFSVYGANDYLTDLYDGKGDVSLLKDKIDESFESEIHLYFEIKPYKLSAVTSLLSKLKQLKVLNF